MDKYQQSQKNKLFKTPPHDPYCLPRVEGSAVCPQCDAVYQAGNWTWNRPENAVVHDAQTVTCPACRRIADNMPAGTLMLSGGFLQKHHDEIIHLIENTEKTEMAEHALERIMRVTEGGGRPDGDHHRYSSGQSPGACTGRRIQRQGAVPLRR